MEYYLRIILLKKIFKDHFYLCFGILRYIGICFKATGIQDYLYHLPFFMIVDKKQCRVEMNKQSSSDKKVHVTFCLFVFMFIFYNLGFYEKK